MESYNNAKLVIAHFVSLHLLLPGPSEDIPAASYYILAWDPANGTALKHTYGPSIRA